MIRGIHHVAISTPDLDRLLGFYRDLLGFREVMNVAWPEGSGDIDEILGLENSSARQVMLRADNLCLELFEFTQPEPKPMQAGRLVCDHGHTHICFDVTDIDSVYKRMIEAGIHFHCPPKDFGDIKATYGRDPDGNVFELQELLRSDDPAQVIPAG